MSVVSFMIRKSRTVCIYIRKKKTRSPAFTVNCRWGQITIREVTSQEAISRKGFSFFFAGIIRPLLNKL